MFTGLSGEGGANSVAEDGCLSAGGVGGVARVAHGFADEGEVVVLLVFQKGGHVDGGGVSVGLESTGG